MRILFIDFQLSHGLFMDIKHDLFVVIGYGIFRGYWIMVYVWIFDRGLFMDSGS